jgi:hypothetical protein
MNRIDCLLKHTRDFFRGRFALGKIPGRRSVHPTRGQSLVEFAMVLPLFLLLILGVIEVGYALLDQHIITKLTREGSNLISRDTTLQDAGTAMNSMANAPVDFSTNRSKLIFSVLLRVSNTGATNYNQIILFQRHQIGSLPSQSALITQGSGTFGLAPDYKALNPENDTSFRITNVPANLQVGLGGMVYVTEIYSQHDLITPFNRIGMTVPTRLYSVAYF